MELSELLAEVDGIGPDQFIRSTQPVTATEEGHMHTEEQLDESTILFEAMTPASGMETPSGKTKAATDTVTILGPKLGSLDMVLDVELEMVVELGQTRMPLRDLLSIRSADQFALLQRPEDPLKIYVNDQLVAHGEALIVDGALAVKITEMLAVATTPQEYC
ncbi:MAG: FliM/FliN family flagellar motor switch protein [Armatimonadota bacterium]